MNRRILSSLLDKSLDKTARLNKTVLSKNALAKAASVMTALAVFAACSMPAAAAPQPADTQKAFSIVDVFGDLFGGDSSGDSDSFGGSSGDESYEDSYYDDSYYEDYYDDAYDYYADEDPDYYYENDWENEEAWHPDDVNNYPEDETYEEDRFSDDLWYEDDTSGQGDDRFTDGWFTDSYDHIIPEEDQEERTPWGAGGERVPGIDSSDTELASWETGIGSAGELDGNIVVVSIFADDEYTLWNFRKTSDRITRQNSLKYLKIATEWISRNGRSWGYSPVFIYDWEDDPDLYYEMELSLDITDDYEDPSDDMFDFIEDSVDSDALLRKYDADSILYMTFFNTSLRNEYVSFTIPYSDGCEDEAEICYILTGCDGEQENPATYAHEMLHTFGAPDLYSSDNPEYNYNISDRFVRYCERNLPNEIMMTTYDYRTQESYYDHISNELTDITAYYIGWTDTCSLVDEFGLQESQFVD